MGEPGLAVKQSINDIDEKSIEFTDWLHPNMFTNLSQYRRDKSENDKYVGIYAYDPECLHV